MNQRNLRSLLASMGLGVALVLSANVFAHEPKSSAMGASSEGSMELHRIMAKGQKMPMPMSGNVDKDFATMMSMHHQMAIDMVDVLLKHSSNAELKAMASKMKAAQQEEIQQMAPYTK